ncbi:MAG: hypothetical protein WD738_11545 [Pirellulales bacterium]
MLRSLDRAEQPTHFLPREHHGQAFRPFRADGVERREVDLENVFV